MKERKELAVGDTAIEAISNFVSIGKVYDPEKHEAVQDSKTGLWSIFYRRKHNDHSVKRPIKRESRHLYREYGKDARLIVLTLLPGEIIESRLKHRRKGHFITWNDLHSYLTRRDALVALAKKKSERAAKKQQRKKNRR